MRAYVLHRYNRASSMQLEEIPTPQPGPGEVRIRVDAVGLNPVDLNIAQGKARLLAPLKLPVVAGSDAAGTVEQVGPGVVGFAPGDRVVARSAFTRLGAFAEVLVTDESLVGLVPDGVDLLDAAAMPTAALTALQALRDVLAVGPGSRVLITGGAGGVGTYAIQIAKILGAHVTTTASPRGEALVRGLGADEVVDYTRERLSDAVAGQDAVLDMVGGKTLDESFGVTKRGGSVVSIAEFPDAEAAREAGAGAVAVALFRLLSSRRNRLARRAGVTYRFVFVRPDGADLAQLTRYAQDGVLRSVVDREFPFHELPEALDYVRAGRAKGKVAVRVIPATQPVAEAEAEAQGETHTGR